MTPYWQVWNLKIFPLSPHFLLFQRMSFPTLKYNVHALSPVSMTLTFSLIFSKLITILPGLPLADRLLNSSVQWFLFATAPLLERI